MHSKVTDDEVTHRLVLDVGNSAAKGGLYAGAELERTFALPDDPTQWAKTIGRACRAVNVVHAGLSCVVPAKRDHAIAALRQHADAPPLTVSTDLDLPYSLAHDSLQTLGADRVATSAAGWVRYGKKEHSVLVVDAGTAVTCDVVSAEGVHQGGTIAPGFPLLRRALHKGTAQLPDVPLSGTPDSVIGRSTREAMKSGLMHGLIDSTGGMIKRLRGALQTDPVVVATGGAGRWLSEQLSVIDHHAPHLVLHGIWMLMKHNEP